MRILRLLKVTMLEYGGPTPPLTLYSEAHGLPPSPLSLSSASPFEGPDTGISPYICKFQPHLLYAHQSILGRVDLARGLAGSRNRGLSAKEFPGPVYPGMV